MHVIINPFIIVDGYSYLYRAYYAFPSLINNFGEPTGAIYGMLNMLKRLLMQYQPSHFVVVFDDHRQTFRHQLFTQYKCNRPPMPEGLRIQITKLYPIIQAMGLSKLCISGVEADDVIGTIALLASQNGSNVLISTSDKDMTQLVSTKINLLNTMSNSILDAKKVKKIFGIPPELIIDYLALIGDKIDNIPGIPGIGKKTALFLLQEIGGLNNIYLKINNIKYLNLRGAKTLAKKLEYYRDIAYLSYKLATIKTNVILNVSYDQLSIKNMAVEKLILLFQYNNFNHWIKDLKLGQWLK